MPTATKIRKHPPPRYPGLQRASWRLVGAPGGILETSCEPVLASLRRGQRGTGWTADAPGPLRTLQAYRHRAHSGPWRLRKALKVRWGRHSRPLFAKYRSDRGPAPSSLRVPRSIRMARRAPCAFTETAVKRVIRAVRAAGETPGRIVVTREGFAVEIKKPGASSATDDSGGAAAPAVVPRGVAEANLWDQLLGVSPDRPQ
jgi:hypothetical protein